MDLLGQVGTLPPDQILESDDEEQAASNEGEEVVAKPIKSSKAMEDSDGGDEEKKPEKGSDSEGDGGMAERTKFGDWSSDEDDEVGHAWHIDQHIVVKDRIMDLKESLPLQFLDRIVDRNHISKEWKNDRLNCVSIRSSCFHHVALKCSLLVSKSQLHAAKIDHFHS